MFFKGLKEGNATCHPPVGKINHLKMNILACGCRPEWFTENFVITIMIVPRVVLTGYCGRQPFRTKS